MTLGAFLVYFLLAAGIAFVLWPNQLRAKIVSSIVINRPVEAVFDYATTPAHWPEWHPASRAVRRATDHPLELAEEVEEEFVAAGRPGHCVWKVTQRQAPTLWTVNMRMDDIGAEITYRLTAEGGATRFERTLIYWTSGMLVGLADLLIMRGRNRRESEAALERLKQRLEHGAA